MIRSELLQALARENPELRAEDVERAVDTFFEEIAERLGVVPGPAIKNENELAQPPVPRGPIPEVDLSKIRFGSGDNAQQPPAPTPSATPPGQSVEAPRD